MLSDNNSKQPSGVILSIVGPPGSGKSYVSRKLARHYRAVLLLENPDRFPQRIKTNLEERTRLLETFLWFRNDEIKKQNKATKIKSAGKIVILDTFWLSSQLFLRCYQLDSFELAVALEIAKLDSHLLPWPDVIIYLRAHRHVTRKHVANRVSERHWERTRSFQESAKCADTAHRQFFALHSHPFHLITLNATHADFRRTRDFDDLVSKIDHVLKSRFT